MDHLEGKSNQGRTKDLFFEFEQKVIRNISQYMPNLEWIATNQTRDGNKDAYSEFRNAITGENMQAWLEVKFRKNPSRAISSRAFDSTLVSASQETNLAALFFATNAKTPKSLHFRVISFCNRSIPNLRNFRVFDENSLNHFDEYKDSSHKHSIEDLIVNEPVIVNCIDYSNHWLLGEESIYLQDIYYVVFPVFLTLSSENVNSNVSIYHQDTFVGEYKLIDAWNFLAFRSSFFESDFDSGNLIFELRFGDNRKLIKKQIKYITGKHKPIFYNDELIASKSISAYYRSIINKEQRRVILLIEGAAATGKTTLAESICADWSETHEIFLLQVVGVESIDLGQVYELAKFIFDADAKREHADHQSVKDYHDNRRLIEHFSNHLRISKRRKAVVLDDLHKASDEVGFQLIELLHRAAFLCESLNIFLFSRPSKISIRAEHKFALNSKIELHGPSREDIRHTFEKLLGRQLSVESINILHKLCPNLVNLNQVFVTVSEERSTENIHQLFSEREAKDLLELPNLSKAESDALYLIYASPNGLTIDDLRELNFHTDVIDNLLNNRLILFKNDSLKPVHDLWREVVLSNSRMITESVLQKLRRLSYDNDDIRLMYLSTAIKLAKSIQDEELTEAREMREYLIEESQFGRARVLAESIASSKFHKKIQANIFDDIAVSVLIIRDYIRAGEVLNHCGYHAVSRRYFNRALEVSSQALHDPCVKDLALWCESEIYNLDYWAFDLSFLSANPTAIVDDYSADEGLLRKVSKSAILNRSMMALYLLDRVDEARSIFEKASKFCKSEDLILEGAHLLMDSAKNEMIFSMEKSITLFGKAIEIYKERTRELRRLLIAETQRESLRLKMEGGSISALLEHISNLEKHQLYQEHMNSMIDLATYFAFKKDNNASLSCLNRVNAHPDYTAGKRRRIKVAQCKAIIEINNANIISANNLYTEALNQMSGIGSSYRAIPEHNLSIEQPKYLAWYQTNSIKRSDTIYIDPRLW